jgi:hypothetical protein
MSNVQRRLVQAPHRLMNMAERWVALARAAQKKPSQDPSVVLARVIGNDHWPRHATGQSLHNLEFILTREPAFHGVRKLFVLNRLVDPEVQARAEAMVQQFGHDVLNLPFDPEAYAVLRLDTSDFGGDEFFLGPEAALGADARKEAERLWVAAPKIRYAMNVNGARNAALDWGKARADWTLVLDGSCFLTAPMFQSLRADLTSRPVVPYVVLPMRRLAANEAAFTTSIAPNKAEEPQLLFSAQSKGRFDEALPYGMRDKTSLLQQIGVPGDWDLWKRRSWLPALGPLPDRNLWKRAGISVFRLSSGESDRELKRPTARLERYQSRNRGIFLTLAALDDRFATADRDRARAILGLDDIDFSMA